MRVMLVWHGATGGLYQDRLQSLAADGGVQLHVVVPERWHENGRILTSRSEAKAGYEFTALPVRFPYHGAYYFYTSRLGRLVRSWAPDVIHIHEEPWSLAALQLLWQRDRHCRDAAVVVESWQNIYKRFPFPFSHIEQLVIRRADHLIAGSEEIKRVLERKGATAPITVVPLATSPERFRRTVDPELKEKLGAGRPLIGYVGRLVAEKGLEWLLAAAAALKTPFRLVFIGTGPLRAKLERKAAELGLAERVLFIDAIPYEDVPTYISALDVLVLPSLTTPTWKEQFGRVLIEAMACQVAVVGSDSGEIPQVIGDAGLVVPEGDVPALAGALTKLLSNQAYREALAERGYRRTLQLFTWERVSALTVNVYEEALAHRRGSRCK